MARLILFAILLFTGFSCSREPLLDCPTPYEISYLKAKVVTSSDLTCNRPVLEFSEDSFRVRQISGLADLTYVGHVLQTSLNVTGKKLYLSVAKMPANEEFACNTLGISYPHLKILDAKARP